MLKLSAANLFWSVCSQLVLCLVSLRAVCAWGILPSSKHHCPAAAHKLTQQHGKDKDYQQERGSPGWTCATSRTSICTHLSFPRRKSRFNFQLNRNAGCPRRAILPQKKKNFLQWKQAHSLCHMQEPHSLISDIGGDIPDYAWWHTVTHPSPKSKACMK